MKEGINNLFIAVLVIALWLTASSVLADVNYSFVNQDGDVESKIGPMVEKIVTVIAGAGIGVCFIGIGVGALKFFGRVFKMDKEDGAEKMKAGTIGVLAFVSVWAIFATIFHIAGKS